MLIVVAAAEIETRNRERMEGAGCAMIAASRAEEGCLGYSYGWDFTSPNTMNAIEMWRDEEALRFHFRTPHMKAFLTALADMGNNPPQITVYEGGNGHPIGRYAKGSER